MVWVLEFWMTLDILDFQQTIGKNLVHKTSLQKYHLLFTGDFNHLLLIITGFWI